MQRAQVLEQVEHEPADVLSLRRKLLDERQRSGGVAVDDEVAEPEERLLLDRAEELQDVLHGDLRLSVAAASWSSVDSASRYAPRAPRAIERERLVRHVDLLRVRDQAQFLHELREPRPLEDERLAARAHRRQHLGEIRGAEDEDEVRRRLLDQLQQRVPGGVGELVRLVEDVDLVAPFRRLEDDALADLADVVDAALRCGVHLDHVE